MIERRGRSLRLWLLWLVCKRQQSADRRFRNSEVLGDFFNRRAVFVVLDDGVCLDAGSLEDRSAAYLARIDFDQWAAGQSMAAMSFTSAVHEHRCV